MTTLLKQLSHNARCRSILCLHGELPDAGFFADNTLPVIAADGAANTLHDLGIQPAIVIGDLDNVTESIRKQSKVLYRPDQNSSDFEKCLVYLRENNLMPALITGLSGGYLDHILNNVSLFLQTDSLFYSPPIAGFALRPGEQTLALPLNTKISLMGFPEAVVSTKGLKWELTNSRLCFPGVNSCFNRSMTPAPTIQVTQGQILVLIYLSPVKDAGAAV